VLGVRLIRLGGGAGDDTLEPFGCVRRPIVISQIGAS
jgi:hypothetical protein